VKTDGDNIYIDNGRYSGEGNTNLSLGKSINFIGTGTGQVVIDMQG
jgi:hypothetical protein